MTATLDEATMARMLERVPPAEAGVPPPTEEPPAEASAAESQAEPEPVEETVAPAGVEEEVGPPAEVPEAQGEELEPYAAMDPSLQDIFRKEVQLHLDIVRDFLRKVWVTPGPHYVTDELYRACHTLRGASRTAESSECIRLADPLHRWLRRLFDADRAFDEEGLATLADAVAAFEDIVESVVGTSDYLPTLESLIARLQVLDLALEQALAAEPPEEAQATAEPPAAPEEPTEAEETAEATDATETASAEAPLSIEHLIPQISVETRTPRARLGAGFDRLLPESPDERSVGGEMPYGPDAALPLEASADEAEPLHEQQGPGSIEEPEVSGPAEADMVPEGLPPPSAIEEETAAQVDMLQLDEGLQPGIAAEPEPEPEPEVEPEPGQAAEFVDLAAGAEEVSPTHAEQAPDYDADIAAIFSEEATELLEAADSSLGAIRAERGSGERIVELQRALHTLKGGARMAGISAMGDLSHELESLLTQVSSNAAPLDERSFEVLQASLDELNRMRDFVNAGRVVPPARDLITRIQMVARGVTPEPAVEAPAELEAASPAEAPAELEAASPAEPWPEHAPGEAPVAGEIELAPAGEPPQAEPEGLAADIAAQQGAAEAAPVVEQAPVLPGREGAAERAEMARVDADLLDTMLNNAGEVSIFRARLEQQLSSVDFNLAELARVVARLKEQLRKLEIETEAQILHRHVESAPRRTDFDPLELDRYSTIQQYSRALGETAADVASVQALLGSLTREAQNLLTQQGRIVSDLQNSLMRTRMVPFQRHVQRLTRIVRQAAAELGKRADLTVTGAAGELDRQVLDRMLPPFEHLVRNAVVHGIESPEERVKAGKPEAGRIELTLRREGSEVVIVVADDGAGINLRAVREKAISLGIASPKQDLSDEQATQLILEPGFTTAGKITQSAGRGVGMDVVVTEIKKLGGALFIESEEGRGTRFTVRLPFTLAISQALVVRSGDEFFALPLPTVEGVVRVPAAEVERQLVADTAAFEYGGQQYRFQHLSTFVGGEASRPAEHDPAVPVILIRAGEHSTGIVTDELIGSREIVVKSVGPQIAGIRGISGATILGDGRICIILDVGALVRSEWRARPQPEKSAREREDNRLFALVVDDSITVRRVTQRLLERNGMRVMTAKDGLDAIAVLQDHVPDVILLDIEMPRMDGYEVASHVRNDPRLKDVPIVMITSRVGEKHRARAIELGVNDYLGKPYQEAQLLQALEPLLQRRRAS
jgi:chemosensory pili system protein ChpA (sensor histidine kinase/response regulator)